MPELNNRVAYISYVSRLLDMEIKHVMSWLPDIEIEIITSGLLDIEIEKLK